MPVRVLIACSAALLVCFSSLPHSTFAQNRATGFGGIGQGQGQGGLGFGSQQGFGGGMQGGFGQNQFGGGMGMGQQGFGQGAMGQNPQQLRQSQQMMGAGQGQDNFIGSGAAASQNFFRNLGMGQRRAMGMNFMIENLNEMRDQGGQGGPRNEPPPVRLQFRPAFEVSASSAATVSQNVKSRLTNDLDISGVENLEIHVEDRRATLVGTVPTEHDLALIGKIVSFEPGISQVENQLEVEPASNDGE